MDHSPEDHEVTWRYNQYLFVLLVEDIHVVWQVLVYKVAALHSVVEFRLELQVADELSHFIDISSAVAD